MDTFASRARVPHLHVGVFATSNNQTLEGVPVAGLHIGTVVSEGELLFRLLKIEDLCCVIVGAGDEFETRIGKRQISYTSLFMGLKLVLLLQLYVRVDDGAFLIPRNYILLIVAHSDRLHRLAI